MRLLHASPLIAAALIGCRNDYALTVAQETEPVTLKVTSPEYGQFMGEEQIRVAGVVTPPGTVVVVEDEAVLSSEEDGSFEVLLPVDGPYRIVEVVAAEFRERIPVFSGNDPEDTWPGGLSARLLPRGLDRIGAEVGALIDNTGWSTTISSQLPGVSGDWYAITPVGVVHDPTVVALEGVTGGIDTAVSLRNVGIEYSMELDLGIITITEPITLIFNEIALGATAIPVLESDGTLTLELTDADLVMDDPDFEFGVLEGWVIEWLLDNIGGFILEPLTEFLLDFVLAEFGVLELGGPLAFETDLLGTSLALELADVGGDPDGVRAGLAVGINEPVSSVFDVTTPQPEDGDPSHVAVGIHEGLLDVLLGGELLGMLDQELDLGGSFGDILGAGVEQLPGGDQVPSNDGWCFSLDPGTATVARMQTGIEPLAVLYVPDLIVSFGTKQGAVCEDWLVASLAAEINVEVSEGAKLGIDIATPEGAILYYGAEGWDEDEVVAGLGDYIGGLVGLLGGVAEIDLGDLLGGTELIPGLAPVSISVVDSQPLYNEDGTWTEGLYSVTLTLWDE